MGDEGWGDFFLERMKKKRWVLGDARHGDDGDASIASLQFCMGCWEMQALTPLNLRFAPLQFFPINVWIVLFFSFGWAKNLPPSRREVQWVIIGL